MREHDQRQRLGRTAVRQRQVAGERRSVGRLERHRPHRRHVAGLEVVVDRGDVAGLLGVQVDEGDGRRFGRRLDLHQQLAMVGGQAKQADRLALERPQGGVPRGLILDCEELVAAVVAVEAIDADRATGQVVEQRRGVGDPAEGLPPGLGLHVELAEAALALLALQHRFAVAAEPDESAEAVLGVDRRRLAPVGGRAGPSTPSGRPARRIRSRPAAGRRSRSPSRRCSASHRPPACSGRRRDPDPRAARGPPPRRRRWRLRQKRRACRRRCEDVRLARAPPPRSALGVLEQGVARAGPQIVVEGGVPFGPRRDDIGQLRACRVREKLVIRRWLIARPREATDLAVAGPQTQHQVVAARADDGDGALHQPSASAPLHDRAGRIGDKRRLLDAWQPASRPAAARRAGANQSDPALAEPDRP